MVDICKRSELPACVVGSVSDWNDWLKICSTKEELPCDVVELRVDALPKAIRSEDILAQKCPKPVLLTIRHTSEGGLGSFSECDRLAMAKQLLPMVSYLDWETAKLGEAQELVEAAHSAGVAIIASHHDFEKTPSLETLQTIERQARSLGADVVKFAFKLHSAEDMLVGVQLLRHASGALAVMGMGVLGPVSRLLYAQHGSALVYGFLGKTPTAPGQWGAEICLQALAGLSRV